MNTNIIFRALLSPLFIFPGTLFAESEKIDSFFSGIWTVYAPVDEAILTFNLPITFKNQFFIVVSDEQKRAKPIYLKTIELTASGKVSPITNGNTILVEGAGFSIQPSTESISGSWSINKKHSDKRIPFTAFNSTWNSSTAKTTVVDLDSPHYIVITYTISHVCGSGSAYLEIDGKRPIDSNKDTKPIYGGNSILTYGKKVEFYPSGPASCTNTFRNKVNVKIASPEDIPAIYNPV